MTAPALIALHGARGAGKDTTYQFINHWCTVSDPALSAVRRGFADKMKWAYMRMWVPDCTQEWAINFIDQWKNDLDATCAGIFTDDEGILLEDTRKKIEKMTDSDDEPLYFIPPVNFRDHMNQFATESAREVYGDDHWVDQLLPAKPDARNPEGWHGSFLTPPKTDDDWPYSIADFCVITDLRAENEVERVKELGGLCVKIKRRDAEEKQRRYYEERGEDPHLFASELPEDLMDVVINNDDNDMDEARRRTNHLMHEIKRNGIDSIKRGLPRPWRIG